MTAARPVVVVAVHPDRRAEMLAAEDLAWLSEFAAVEVEDFHGPSTIDGEPEPDDAAEQRLGTLAQAADALVVAHGAPRVSARVLDAAPGVTFVGELEGDRFCGRIDVAAAQARDVLVVDTTHGSSWPVAEWALALAVLGLRDASRFIRRFQAHDLIASGGRDEPHRTGNRELSDRRVGLIGFGHIAWRLVELLRPFRVTVVAYDPYTPRELAEATGVTLGTLDAVMASSDVVICLAPLTAASRGLVQERHLRLLRPGSTFVNVSRGAVVDTHGLEVVAKEGQVSFCLDVLDPEPVPADHPLRDLPNVLLTPHLAGTTEETRQRFFHLMVAELDRHFSGLEPRAQLTPRVLASRHGTRSAQAAAPTQTAPPRWTSTPTPSPSTRKEPIA